MALVVTDLQTQTQWALVAMPAPILLCACPFRPLVCDCGERVEGGALFCASALSSSSLRPLRLCVQKRTHAEAHRTQRFNTTIKFVGIDLPGLSAAPVAQGFGLLLAHGIGQFALNQNQTGWINTDGLAKAVPCPKSRPKSSPTMV